MMADTTKCRTKVTFSNGRDGFGVLAWDTSFSDVELSQLFIAHLQLWCISGIGSNSGGDNSSGVVMAVELEICQLHK